MGQFRDDYSVMFWASVSVSGGTPTLAANLNVSSITDSGVGFLTVTLTSRGTFASTNYVTQCTVTRASTASAASDMRLADERSGTRTTSVCAFDCFSTLNAPAAADPSAWSIVGHGPG